jgi:hypothetical protein
VRWWTWGTSLPAQNRQYAARKASASEIGPAIAPVFSAPNRRSLDAVRSNAATSGDSHHPDEQQEQQPTPGTQSRRRTLANILLHRDRNADDDDDDVDDIHATDALHSRLPVILAETRHSEMFGVPLVPAVVGMQPDVPTRIVLNKFLRGNFNNVDAADRQLRSALL